MNRPTRSRAFSPLLVAAEAASVGLSLLGVMLWNADMLVRLGLTGYVWYVLLVPLGLAAAITTFSLFKSYARYQGKALNGTVEIGGPAVIMLLVLILGFSFVPAPKQRFDLTVFVHGEAGHHVAPLRNHGRVFLDLGADRRSESIGDKGEARFAGIPADLRDGEVTIALESDVYELADPKATIKLSQEAVYMAARAKRLHFTGEISDEQGRPLPQARVSIAGVVKHTDADGRFDIELPADLPEGSRGVTITANGFEPWRGQATPGSNSLQVWLDPLPPTKIHGVIP